VNDPAYVYTYDAEGNRVGREALAVNAPGRVQTIDNTPTTSGGSWTTSSDGYGGSQHIGTGTGFLSISAATATWRISALPAGTYDVFATWSRDESGLATESFTTTTTSITGSQSQTTSPAIDFSKQPPAPPAGLSFGGVNWTPIGRASPGGTADVTVTLSSGANKTGVIVADAILFRPVSLDVARTAYEWDHQNRLTKVINYSATFAPNGDVEEHWRDTTTYVYDVLGRRTTVTYDQVGPNDAVADFQRVSIYDGSQVVWTERAGRQVDLAPIATTQAMLWAPGTDQLLVIQERMSGQGSDQTTWTLTKQPVWTLTDPQGTVKDYLAKAPTAGAESGLLLTRRFSAFGAPIDATLCFNGPTSDANPRSTFTDHLARSGFFYVGQEYDATTGLQYSRARYYDPVSSEFISQDPLGFAGGDTNLYRRAGNSPANATDPSGMILPAIALAVGAKLAIGYLATQATFALAETAIEVGATSWAGGEVSAGYAAETFGKNFAINVATGGIGTKAKLASRVGLYALRQGIEIGGDTAFDVGWRGQDFRSSLAINTAGSLIGEAAGGVAIAAARRALSRGSVDAAADLGVSGPRSAGRAMDDLSLRILNPTFTPNATLPELIIRQTKARGLATPRDGLVLWSGIGRHGKTKSQAWAKVNGGQTLEMTPGGRWLEDLDLFGAGGKALGISQVDATLVWNEVSRQAVRQASGQVRALLGNGYRKGKSLQSITYYSVELPELLNNPAARVDELWLLPRVGIR
jgi:RHS repeat-associated protein